MSAVAIGGNEDDAHRFQELVDLSQSVWRVRTFGVNVLKWTLANTIYKNERQCRATVLFRSYNLFHTIIPVKIQFLDTNKVTVRYAVPEIISLTDPNTPCKEPAGTSVSTEMH